MAEKHAGLGQVISWYICTVAAVPFVALRMYSRWKRLGYLAIEDYLIILALCCLIGDLGIQQHMWNLGLARLSEVAPGNLKGILKMIVPGSILYVSSLWAVKFALVIFYKRLAILGSRLVLLYNIVIGMLIATYLLIFFDILFQCFPYDKRWSTDPNYQCDPKAAEINYWITIMCNILSDVTIIVLPITMVSRLHMKLKQKIAVSGMFALGFLVVIASIVRAYFSHSREQMLTCTVSMIENTIAIIAACLPALRSMIMGDTTRGPSTYSYGKHYELSSPRRQINEICTGASNGTVIECTTGAYAKSPHPANDSEDSLVASGLSVGLDGRGKIRVDTTFEAVYEDNDGKSKAQSPSS